MTLLRWLQNLLVPSALGLLLFCDAGPVNACVEGLVWGMPLEQVTAHLGEGQAVNEQQSGRYATRDVLLDQLPVSPVSYTHLTLPTICSV